MDWILGLCILYFSKDNSTFSFQPPHHIWLPAKALLVVKGPIRWLKRAKPSPGSWELTLGSYLKICSQCSSQPCLSAGSTELNLAVFLSLLKYWRRIQAQQKQAVRVTAMTHLLAFFRKQTKKKTHAHNQAVAATTEGFVCTNSPLLRWIKSAICWVNVPINEFMQTKNFVGICQTSRKRFNPLLIKLKMQWWNYYRSIEGLKRTDFPRKFK